MKRVQLLSTNPADAWRFLELAKMPKAAVEDHKVTGFFSDSELETARKNFEVEVQDYIPVETATPPTAEKTEEAAAVTNTKENIKLTGKSGAVYSGTIHTKKDDFRYLPALAIIALSNSTLVNDQWQHKVHAIYKSGNVQEDVERFMDRTDIAHIMIIPVHEADKSKIDAVDDLIRQYLHG